ncbi:hypothetical protein ARAF_2336 [Arsenophonus endosymbiont of Aleurodicus floccissimus]|nr:hypothetical protein ARAF_2336 [Arsenophonus endosymbiont of Aleurodicus floccissimus]
MRISPKMFAYGIQVCFKDADTPKEYISAREPLINNDFLKFTTFDSVEFLIPVSRIKYVKTVPIEKMAKSIGLNYTNFVL